MTGRLGPSVTISCGGQPTKRSAGHRWALFLFFLFFFFLCPSSVPTVTDARGTHTRFHRRSLRIRANYISNQVGRAPFERERRPQT